MCGSVHFKGSASLLSGARQTSQKNASFVLNALERAVGTLACWEFARLVQALSLVHGATLAYAVPSAETMLRWAAVLFR